jgi:hypothetical protein
MPPASFRSEPATAQSGGVTGQVSKNQPNSPFFIDLD